MVFLSSIMFSTQASSSAACDRTASRLILSSLPGSSVHPGFNTNASCVYIYAFLYVLLGVVSAGSRLTNHRIFIFIEVFEVKTHTQALMMILGLRTRCQELH